MKHALRKQQILFSMAFCFLQGSKCTADLLAQSGGIISNMGASMNKGDDTNMCFPKVKEAELKKYAESVDWFNESGSIFPEIVQDNYIGEDFISMKKSLAKTRKHYSESVHKCMQTNAERKTEIFEILKNLESLQKLISMQIQYGLRKSKHNNKTSIGIYSDKLDKMKTEPPDLKAKTYDSKVENDPKSEISMHSDLVEPIMFKVLEFQAVKLFKIFDKLDSFKTDDTSNSLSNLKISFRLQDNIFQMLDLMYRQNMVAKNTLKEFYQNNDRIEVAVTCMFSKYQSRHHPQGGFKGYHRNTDISPRLYDVSYFRSFFEVIEGSYKRYTRFLYAKEHFKDQFSPDAWKDQSWNLHVESIYELLERMNSGQEIDMSDMSVVEPKQDIQNLFHRFQTYENLTGDYKAKKGTFHLVKFIEDNYCTDSFEIEDRPQFKKKLIQMSSSIQLIEGLYSMGIYLNEKAAKAKGLGSGVYTKKSAIENTKQFCGEILMISNYFQRFNSKNMKDLIPLEHEGVGNNSQESYVQTVKHNFEKLVEEHMSVLQRNIHHLNTSDPFLKSFAYLIEQGLKLKLNSKDFFWVLM